MNAIIKEKKGFFTEKLADYSQLVKLRLTLLVVFSSVIGYLFAGVNVNLISILILSIAGILVTGGANAINEILEKDSDALMSRTSSRPIPTGRMSVTEAAVFAGIAGIVGILLFAIFFNPISGIISAVSLLLYGFVYTPLKKVSSIAVFIGAIPGALPPAIGYIAATGHIDQIALILFGIQFFWQFSHFWAIAWVSYDDYLKADIMLLPDANGRTKQSAIYALIYTLALIPLGLVPYAMGIVGIYGTVILTLTAIYFSYLAAMLVIKCDVASARKLMFGSFLYLPIVQLSILFDKLK